MTTEKARRLTLPEVRSCGCGIAKQLESIEQAICHLESNWWDGKAIHERSLLVSIKAHLTKAKHLLEDLGEMGPHDGQKGDSK